VKVTAYEGVGMNLHHSESSALAEIISEGGRGTLAALLGTTDPQYQRQLADAIIRAAEIIQALRRKKPRS